MIMYLCIQREKVEEHGADESDLSGLEKNPSDSVSLFLMSFIQLGLGQHAHPITNTQQ